MKTIFTAALLTAAIVVACCDVDIDDTTATPADPSGVNVDIQTSNEAPVERREERRENLRDAIEGVNVQVGDGRVKVDVDGE